MGNLQDVFESPDVAGSPEPSVEITFDPGSYFDRWMQDLETSRPRLDSEPQALAEDEPSEFFFESLPGSNCEVTFEGVLHFDGHSMGNIRSPEGTLVVTRRGIVDADIEVGVAMIHGSVTGNITANERVFLGDDARVTGQITTRLLTVKPGAVFHGECVFTGATETVIAPIEKQLPADELEELLVGV